MDMYIYIYMYNICLGEMMHWNRNVGTVTILYIITVIAGLILGLRPANERRRYFVTTSLIGWVQI